MASTSISRRTSVSALARFALVGLVLRVAVPAGYMPTNLEGGWFLTLCPQGMPVHVMTALLGEGHRHHHQPPVHTPHGPTPAAHLLHQQAIQTDGPTNDNPAVVASEYVQCDLGGALTTDVVNDPTPTLLDAPTLATSATEPSATSLQNPRRTAYRSRAPPNLSFS